MRKLLVTLMLLLIRKDGFEMMAKLWAIEVMSQETAEDAKEVYSRAPRLLKEKVRAILMEAGMEELTEG